MDGSIYEFETLPLAFHTDAGGFVAPVRRALSRGASPLVGVIRNPRSHRNRGHMPEMDGRPNILNAVPGTRAELARTLAGFAERGIDLLVVDGGDGTMRDVLTCGAPIFGANWPPLIVLPKGKTNALAVDLGLPNHWSLIEALEAAREGRVVERRPVMVDRPDKEGGQVLGFILGAGIFTIATQAGQTAHRFGAFNSFAVALTAAAGVVQALFGVGKTAWRARTGMRVWTGRDQAQLPHSKHARPGERYSVLFSTLGRFPLGMRPFGRQSEGLRYAVVDAPLRRVVAMMPGLLAGWEHSGFVHLGIHRGVTDEAVIELADRFILDGEAFPPGCYRLRMGPKLQFIAP